MAMPLGAGQAAADVCQQYGVGEAVSKWYDRHEKAISMVATVVAVVALAALAYFTFGLSALPALTLAKIGGGVAAGTGLVLFGEHRHFNKMKNESLRQLVESGEDVVVDLQQSAPPAGKEEKS